MRRLFQILFCATICLVPVLAAANSVEYVFDDAFFSGSYSPEYYESADLFFNQNNNYFWGKIFFQDLKELTQDVQLEISGGDSRYCTRQLRGFYINTARGNRVRPLDEDSLVYLQTVDPSYDNLMMTGGLYAYCGYPDNWVFGYIQHTWSGENYSLIAGLELNLAANQYLPSYQWDGNFMFENDGFWYVVTWYLRDSYGGVAQLIWSGLDVEYACGDATIDAGETCDDGSNNGLLGYCNLTCNSIVTSVCDNAIQETGETCDEWAELNGLAGHCNHTCNGIIAVTPGPGPTPNACASVNCSTQVSPLCCPEDKIKTVFPSTWLAIPNETKICSVEGSPYSLELTEAFSFAYSVGVTSQCPITKADLNGKLLRKHAAKMISNFAINVLWKTTDSLAICEFTDMSKETPEMQYYARLACKLGIMGLLPDGTPDTKFTPNGEVTRAQFGTMLSRLLYGNENNGKPGQWYTAHLNALKVAGIMTKISIPTALELRGRVMVMLERVSK